MKTAGHQLNTTLLLKETLGVLRINLASFLSVAVLTMGFFMLVSLSSVLLIPVREGSTLRETWASTPWRLKAWVFVGAFAFLALLVRAMATTVYLASESCERGDARIRRAVGQIRRRNLGIIWFCGLASTMLSLFFFVPVILAALFIAPAIPAGLLEDLRWSQAIARARALNKGSYDRLLVLSFLLRYCSWLSC